MPCGVDRANAEENVVLADVEGYVRVRSDVAPVRPEFVGRVAPDNLVGGARRGEGGGLPGELGVVVEVASEDVDLLRLAWGSGERGERGRVEAGDVGDIGCVNELEQVAVLDAVFRAQGLVLVVEVFAPLGEANGGETRVVKAGMVTTAEIAVAAEDHDGAEGRGRLIFVTGRREVGRGELGDAAGEFAGGGVILCTQREHLALLLGRGGRGDRLGEDANDIRALLRFAGRGVAANDVVIERGDEGPTLGLGEFCEVVGAVEALFFAGDGCEDNGSGDLDFGKGAGRFDGDGRAAGIVVCAGSGDVGVHHVGGAGVIMAGDEGPGRVFVGGCAMEDRVDVDEARGAGEAAGATAGGRWLLDEVIALDLKAVSTGRGDGAELGLDPVRGGVDALAGGLVGVHAGESVAGAEAHELGDVSADGVGRDGAEGSRDGRIRGGRGQTVGGWCLAGSRECEADCGGSKCKKELHSSVSESAGSNRQTNCRRPMLTSYRRAVRTSEAARDAF